MYLSRIAWLCAKPPAFTSTPSRAPTRHGLPSLSVRTPLILLFSRISCDTGEESRMSTPALSATCSRRPWSASPARAMCLPVSFASAVRTATLRKMPRAFQRFFMKPSCPASS